MEHCATTQSSPGTDCCAARGSSIAIYLEMLLPSTHGNPFPLRTCGFKESKRNPGRRRKSRAPQVPHLEPILIDMRHDELGPLATMLVRSRCSLVRIVTLLRMTEDTKTSRDNTSDKVHYVKYDGTGTLRERSPKKGGFSLFF